ncbi:hypothetical protein GJ744_007973, partial [Endocarpon pusillum]
KDSYLPRAAKIATYDVTPLTKYLLSAFCAQSVGRGNALRIDLPASWRMHPVISKIHLDPVLDPANDLFQRNVPPPPDHIDEEGIKEWRVEKIVGKLANGEAI